MYRLDRDAIMDGFAPNVMRRFLGGKERPSSSFVTIGRGKVV